MSNDTRECKEGLKVPTELVSSSTAFIFWSYIGTVLVDSTRIDRQSSRIEIARNHLLPFNSANGSFQSACIFVICGKIAALLES